jgi:peptidoglycan/xylan/chitin deacetylase (PgdA/CDA1 family)
VIQSLSDYYRVPLDSLGRTLAASPSGDVGFFRFGAETICYGQCASGVSTKVEQSGLYDAFKSMRFTGSEIHLPFDPATVIESLRREHYEGSLAPGRQKIVTQEWILKAYYFVRGILPDVVRRHMQRAYFSDWKNRPFPAWPVDFTVDTLHENILQLSMEAAGIQRIPFIWFWPDGAPNCLILTHDVETSVGRDFTPQLMDLDESYGFKASFQVIPEKRYEVPNEYVQEIRNRGFEFNIHDLNHDGHLYQEREEFLRRAKKINEYEHRYSARGFRAGAMYRNLDWYDAYEFSYDMSVPNVAHLEPKRGGCCTVFPFFVGKIVELPLTTSQDYSVFHILNDYSIGLWKNQLELIRGRNGLMSFLAHPDYLTSLRTRKVYESLLDYLRRMVAREGIWAVLPGDVDRWWRARSQMRLVSRGDNWEIVGLGKERARLAYAVLDGGRLMYELAGVSPRKSAVR